jgi:hypothetical protein
MAPHPRLVGENHQPLFRAVAPHRHAGHPVQNRSHSAAARRCLPACSCIETTSGRRLPRAASMRLSTVLPRYSPVAGRSTATPDPVAHRSVTNHRPPNSWNSAKPPGGARGRSDASGRRRRRNMRPVMAIHPHDAHETAAPRRGPRIHDAQCTAAATSPPDGRPPRELPDRWQSHASDRYQPGAQQEDAARSPRYSRRPKTPSQRAEAEQAALRASLPARADHAT